MLGNTTISGDKMKKSVKIFSAVLLTLATLTFTSCEFLDALLNAAGGILEDAFEGPTNTWLEMTVDYQKDHMSGTPNIAFFYTEYDKEGHTKNTDRLQEGIKIEAGLTIICHGEFSPWTDSGAFIRAYYIKHIPLEQNAKAIWSVIYNASEPLRQLEKEGTITGSSTDSWLSGENYGSWHSAPTAADEALGTNDERVPDPLTNKYYGKYLTNDKIDKTKYNSIDWNDAFGKIGLNTSMFN